ncbi:Maf-like protein [Gracilaria domingensis]|nr:Maf-like protein [Gracilaria domingensis]
MGAETDSRWSSIDRLILGSKSWSRRTVLQEMGLPKFDVEIPNIDERSIRHEDPRELVKRIALAKARALLPRISQTSPGKTILITGDSVVTHKGRILEKPAHSKEAREFLESYATGPATTVASIAIIDVAKKHVWIGVDEAEVYFQRMPDDVINELVTTGGALESAGGLRIEHPAVQKYVDYIIGHKTAVMGFSKPLAERLLSEAISSRGGQPI